MLTYFTFLDFIKMTNLVNFTAKIVNFLINLSYALRVQLNDAEGFMANCP